MLIVCKQLFNCDVDLSCVVTSECISSILNQGMGCSSMKCTD